jgi:adenine-specific DNA-methyltransferase
MTRHKEIAFTGTVQYFGGTLLCLVPKSDADADADADTINKIVQYLNSPVFQKDYMYAGRFKIGHKQISTAVIP